MAFVHLQPYKHPWHAFVSDEANNVSSISRMSSRFSASSATGVEIVSTPVYTS
ncbi:MAG: hypothetical protein IPO98_13400 [Saprospiraceae bacterium]|nr:hypothetical protein [Saprospiraceae bacterium]